MTESEAPMPAEGAADTEASEARQPESLAGVLGVGVGLVLIALCILILIGYGPRHLAVERVLADSMQVAELPDGLTLEPEALLLPSGERVVTISNGLPLAIDPRELVTRSPEEGRGGGPSGGSGSRSADFEPYDWAGVETLAEDTLPARLYLVHFPEGRAPAVLADQFRGLRWRGLREIGAKGGTAVVGGGQIQWAGYGADFVRERRFIEGGSFRDTMRVNLSLGRHCWVAYAIWPEQHRASEELLREVLGAFRPIETTVRG